MDFPVVQWLRMHLPMQGTRIRSLVWEAPSFCRACALKPWSHNYWAHVPLLLGEGEGTPLQHSCLANPTYRGAWWAAVHGVVKSRTRLRDFPFTFHFHALEKEMATHSSVFAWRIPGTGEPGGLPCMGSHRVRHDWSDLAATTEAPCAQSLCSAIKQATIMRSLYTTGKSSPCSPQLEKALT